MTMYRYYAHHCVSRQSKDLVIRASCDSEIERMDTYEGDEPAVMVPIDLMYETTKGEFLAEVRGAALVAFWHDPETGHLMYEFNYDDARLTDADGCESTPEEDARITALAGGMYHRSSLDASTELDLICNRDFKRLIECALEDFENELKAEAS